MEKLKRQDDSMQIYWALRCFYKQAMCPPSSTCIWELRTKPNATHISRKDWRFFFPKTIKMPLSKVKICIPFIFSSCLLKRHRLLSEDCVYIGRVRADQCARHVRRERCRPGSLDERTLGQSRGRPCIGSGSHTEAWAETSWSGCAQKGLVSLKFIWAQNKLVNKQNDPQDKNTELLIGSHSW